MKQIRRNISKRYRSFLIKYMALLIGVCYLANPLQSHISSIFHEISHIFEVSETPIGHSTFDDKQHLVHNYHEHTHADDRHEHTLIDLIDSIFNAADDGSQQESIFVDVKFDKHIAIDAYPLHNVCTIEKSFDFVSKENKLRKGHSNILGQPPQSSYYG